MHSECSVLSAQCNSSALTVCVFLFNVTHNTVIVLLVSSLLILLSILLRSACRRPVRLIVRLMRLFTVEFRVSIDNFRVSGEATLRQGLTRISPAVIFWGQKFLSPHTATPPARGRTSKLREDRLGGEAQGRRGSRHGTTHDARTQH